MKSICIGLLAGTCALALQPQGAEAAKSSVEILHSFGAGLDGLSPHANLINVKGQLYGTTGLGGTQSSGTIFTFDPQTCTSKSCTVRVVYSFCSQQNCADGALPPAGLINAGGVLYGTTQKGGSSGNGTVFSFDPKTGAEQVVYSFCSQQNCTDGQYPDASVLDENGTLYGTTQKGGSSGKGTVFSYTITYRGPPLFHGAEPYAVVSATLDIGINVIADMVDCTADELKVGMKVKPYWLPLSNGTHLLMFEPVR